MTAIIIITLQLILLALLILTFIQIRKGFKQTDMQELLRKYIKHVSQRESSEVKFTEKEFEIIKKLS